jgi:MerR family transcriptional regulator, mercuric resistance operon regulatory protein
LLSIGKLAAAAGVGVETVRYYQRRGLLGMPARSDGVRRYGSNDVSRLRFIRQAQGSGFTLTEIQELLDLDSTDDRERARELALARLESLDQKIANLEATREVLRRVAAACSSEGAGPCPIIESFKN